MKTAGIVGSGLVGSLWAIYLAKEGYRVNVFERRADLRNTTLSAGKSINLAISDRGWKALDAIGIGDEIRKIAIPMYGRTIHDQNEKTHFQKYGKDNQAIYSVSRAELNMRLMDLAERSGKVTIQFNEECIAADVSLAEGVFKNTKTGSETKHHSDVLFASDGAFSAIRYQAFQKLDRFNFSQNYIADGYREIVLPANKDGSYKLEKNSLHIWPRGRFMLIALPNADGSFTCTLFMPFEDAEYGFNNLKTVEQINVFFKNTFPDFFKLMPNIALEWNKHPLSSLAIIRCYPWFSGKTFLLGDAAHATVPFFGQGMNCGFEDCTVLWQLMKKHKHDWSRIGEEYQMLRKPNGDAVQDLSLQNYLVMRDKVNDPEFQLLQKVEHRISELYPQKYLPLYSMVSFSNMEYKTALQKGKEQEELLKNLIQSKGIDALTSLETIDHLIHKYIPTTFS